MPSQANPLAGLPLDYLIGADGPQSGKDDRITETSYGVRPAARGIFQAWGLDPRKRRDAQGRASTNSRDQGAGPEQEGVIQVHKHVGPDCAMRARSLPGRQLMARPCARAGRDFRLRECMQNLEIGAGQLTKLGVWPSGRSGSTALMRVRSTLVRPCPSRVSPRPSL
jgi:hypothetical protein